MNDMNIDKLNELLLTVQRPGRYVGGEWNSVKKEWSDDKAKVLLAFPDMYEIGSSYLGMKILYGILNGRDDCLAERVFAPWADFEKVLRENDIRLFSLESKKPIREFDIIGFSLAYELTYTNVLNMLDLGGIPLRSSERRDGDPLIIAGGPSCFNPEPMAEFVDAFLIGDGEEAILEIVDIYKKSPWPASDKGQGRQAASYQSQVDRKKLLRELAKIKGVYVPSLYKVEYNGDGTIKSFAPIEGAAPETIEKRIIKDFNSAFYPTKQIVPNIGIIHDRIAIEIMRGCKHACRFCQASATYRPCRERSKARILELAKEAYAMTGCDEISLLSLSSVDYPHLVETIEELNKEFSPKAVSISVPSLRVEEEAKDLPLVISKVKKSGLTFAPEAGSERMRKTLGKNINIDRLFDASSESFRSGWRKVKLYFMIGLPGEKEEDLAGIIDITHKISGLKKEIDGRPAQVTASINAFVPKPHTAFQREAMDEVASLEQKRAMLKKLVKSKMVELDFHDLGMSYLEAALSRGDRRLSGVIYESWKAGARFDAWGDVFNFNTWVASFERCGIAHAFYVNRKRGPEEILPWDFIDVGSNRGASLKEAVSDIPGPLI